MPPIHQTRHRAVTTIEFSHPAHNSLPLALLHDLAAAITAAGADDTSRVIILRSAGERTFCAGASFDELAQIKTPAAGAHLFTGFAQVINAMRGAPKLIIARVQGKAVGGGVGLAAAADYCLANHHAAVRLSELPLGFGPFVVGPAIIRKIGVAAFSQLTINAANFYPAQWATDQGLYAELHPTTEALDAAVTTLAQTLATYNPAAMRELKRAMWHGTEHWDELLAERAAISGQLAMSDFTTAALARLKTPQP